MFLKTKKEVAFTLIELIVVIFVIGVITSLATVYFSQVKKNNRDYKRLSDITELQVALENYRFFEGTYPDSLNSSSPLTGPKTGKIFLDEIPSNQEYVNSNCSSTTYEYVYDSADKIYYLNFCLEGNIENYTAGSKCAYPGGIKDGVCSL
jgi:prepilin-type N-terminal cleavage/methylation domain-containing protein